MTRIDLTPGATTTLSDPPADRPIVEIGRPMEGAERMRLARERIGGIA